MYSAHQIHNAARLGKLIELKNILDECSSLIDACASSDEMETPLFTAAKNGRDNIIEELIRRGSQALDTYNKNGETPLHIATKGGHASTVELLLRLGSQSIDKSYGASWTPIRLAVVHIQHIEIAQILIRHGCIIPSDSGFLHAAATQDDVVMLELLVKEGKMNVDTCFRSGKTLMFDAARYSGTDIIEKIIELGCTTIDTPNKKGKTPLVCALRLGEKHNAALLIKHGCRTTGTFETRKATVFHYAAEWGRSSQIRLLARAGCTNFDVPNNSGKYPIENAFNFGTRSGAKTLMALNGFQSYTRPNEVLTLSEEEIADERYRIYFRRPLIQRLLDELDLPFRRIQTIKH